MDSESRHSFSSTLTITRWSAYLKPPDTISKKIYSPPKIFFSVIIAADVKKARDFKKILTDAVGLSRRQ